MDNWTGSTVLVSTIDKNHSGTLVSSDVTGLVIAMENSTPASAPFSMLNESSTIELFIPIYRIKHVARGRFTGIA